MIRISDIRLKFVIEAHNTIKGDEYYLVHYCDGTIKFNQLSSVLDFIENNSLGYVEK